MAKSVFVGNLKMNLVSPDEVGQYLINLKREMERLAHPDVSVILCPPSLYLEQFRKLPSVVACGAQNAHWEKSGAFTGEISPLMLKNFGIEHVILGHSERREHFGETDEIVKQKVDAALKHFLTPIVCIGETRTERERGEVESVIARQAGSVFAGLSKLQAENVVLAYEPRWAIGTDVTPTTAEIMEVRILIRKFLTESYDAALAAKVRVLYGGSVKHTTLPEVSWEAEMEGVLVGRESLSPLEVAKMVESLQAAPDPQDAQSL